MSLAALNAVAAGADVATRSLEFATMARLLAASRWDLPLANRRAAALRSPRIETVIKAAVAAGSLSSAAPLAEYQTMVSAFLGSLAQASAAFDRMLSDMRRVPLRTRTGVVTAAATGTSPNEMEVKAISRLQLTGGVLDEHKAVAVIVLSDDLARFAGPDGAALFARELRNAVATVTDQVFISLITAGLTPISSAGSTSANAWTDVRAGFAAVATDQSSRLYILVESATAKAWSTLSASGVRAFAEMTPAGGSVAGVPVLVSGGLAAGTVVVADANAIAAASDTLLLDSTREASLQLDTSPDSPPTGSTPLMSLWQQNAVAMKAERFFGAELLRSNGAAIVSGVSY